MTSNTVGRSRPPNRAGQLSPKKPASKSAVCHSAWRAQYSSSVDDVGRPGLLCASHARNRARNSASAGESRKSTTHLQLAQLHTVITEPLRRKQRPPHVYVGEALPRVADP